MEKTIITFSANEQKLIKTGGIECYASNIVSYIEAHFDLGANWSGYDSVRAVWSNDNNMSVISTVLDSNGICVVPFEVLKTKGVVKVNLVGSISVSDVLTDRLTTFPCEAVKVTAKAKIEGSETQPITPSQFEQFVEAVKEDADRAEQGASDAETYANNAETSADNSLSYSQNAEGSAIRASGYALDAQGYAQNASESATSAENYASDAEDARDEIRNMSANATTLPSGSDATASYSDGVLSLGIPRGDTGATGAKGDTGATPNLTIGTVETLEPTESATATITGTDENPVLNLGLPKGEQGEVSQAQLDAVVSDLKSALIPLKLAVKGESQIDASITLFSNNSAVTNNHDGTYTIGTTDYGYTIFGQKMTLPKGEYLLYGVSDGYSFVSTSQSASNAFATNESLTPKWFWLSNTTECYLGFRTTARPSTAFTIIPYVTSAGVERETENLWSAFTEGYYEYDIARAFTTINNYVNSNGTASPSNGAMAYRKIYVGDCDRVRISNMYLEGSRSFVGADSDGTVTTILTNQGTSMISGEYDVSAYEYISFTGTRTTPSNVWKFGKEKQGEVVHGTEFKFPFNLYDYEIKGTDFSIDSTNFGTAFFEDAITYADKGKSLALRATYDGTHDSEVFVSVPQIDAMGVESFIVPVYTEDASNISRFYMGILKDGETTSPSWFRSTSSISNGWNYFRFDCIDYPQGLETWNHINGYRFLITPMSDATVYIGDVITIKPSKAKLVFICDHGYKNFLDVATPQLASRGIPTTFAMKLSLLGQPIEYSSRILTEEEVTEIAQDQNIDVNIHSALSIPSANQTKEQTREDAWKGLYFLKTHGCYVFPYRSAWWNNLAPYAEYVNDILEVSPSYDGNDDKITVFPFSNPHNVPRCGMHGMSNSAVDAIFTRLKKTHGIVLMYTHDLSDDIPPEGTVNINITTAEFNYLLSKIDTAITEGWIEGTTIRQLYTRYAVQ